MSQSSCKQSLVEIAPTAPAAEAPAGHGADSGGSFDFKVQGTEIEGGASNMR